MRDNPGLRGDLIGNTAHAYGLGPACPRRAQGSGQVRSVVRVQRGGASVLCSGGSSHYTDEK